MRESPASSIKPGTEGELSLREAGHADAPGARVERLYDDYAGRIYRYCLSRLDSPEEAEDALQATYLNAWRSLNSGVEPLSQPSVVVPDRGECLLVDVAHALGRRSGGTAEPRDVRPHSDERRTE